MGFGTGDVEKAWDAMRDPETETNKPAPEPERDPAEPYRDPADMETDELLRTAADAMRRDTGDMLLALYETIREVAKAGGRTSGGIIQTLYELDCILERAERRSEA